MSLPSHLFCADSDGALYDCRVADWSSKAPLRAVYKRSAQDINNTAELRAALRNGQYAWPGGYPMYFITSDGAALSFDAVRTELRQVIWSIQNKVSDGWRVVGCGVNWEDLELTCEHTGQPIPSAYGDD